MCPDHGFPSSSDEESAFRYREKSKRSKKNTQRRIREVSKIIGTKNGSFKGSSYPSHFIFQINVLKNPTYHDSVFNLRRQFQSRSMSDPPFFDIYFKNRMTWL